MIHCARCHRTLSRAPIYVGGSVYGPRCAIAVTGSKPRRVRTNAQRGQDVRQRDLFSDAMP